jgi:hypothetical protein
MIEGAVVAGLLAVGAAGATKSKKNTMMKKSVKELAKSLEKVSAATEDVVKGTTSMTESTLRSLSGMKGKKSKRGRSARRTRRNRRRGKSMRAAKGKGKKRSTRGRRRR